nr:dihydroorotase [Chitinophagaceae bacterium]
MHILIKKATVLSPDSKYHLKRKDILIKNGIIEKIADSINEKAKVIIDKKNMYVSAGWVDVFSDFCDPGFEHRETLESGVQVAAAGGYTDAFVIPNTNPPTANKTAVEYIKHETGLVNLHPIGSVSKNIEGKDLAEMYDMKLAGAIAFSDGRKTIQNSGLLLKALQYVKTFDGIIIEIPEDKEITKNGLMNEGVVSTQIGLQAKASIAEDIHTYRNIELLRYTQSKIHLTGISTKKSIDLIRQAKKQKLNITCSVSPYHLLYSDQMLENYNSHYKVNPPLRSEEDRKALLKAVEDGTIDCIASHHTPQSWDDKQVEFAYAQSGMLTLQTTLQMLLQLESNIPIEKWVTLLSDQPRNIFSLPQPKLEVGANATLTLFSTTEPWTYNEKSNQSLSENSPLFQKTLQGKIVCVINNQKHRIYE